MPRWRIVGWSTAAMSVTAGLLLALSDHGDLVTEEHVFVGWMQVLAGVFVVALRLMRRWIPPKTRNAMQLTAVSGSWLARVPMAVTSAIEGETDWPTALDLSLLYVFAAAMTIVAWVCVVLPGALEEADHARSH